MPASLVRSGRVVVGMLVAVRVLVERGVVGTAVVETAVVGTVLVETDLVSGAVLWSLGQTVARSVPQSSRRSARG
jgi:hypothetical protein